MNAWGQIVHYEATQTSADTRKMEPNQGAIIFVIVYSGTVAIYQILNEIDEEQKMNSSFASNIGVVDLNAG